MVSQEVRQVRREVESQRAEFEEAKAETEAISTRVQRTRQELARVTPQQQQRVKAIEAQREITKQASLKQLATQRAGFETQIEKVEKGIKEFQQWESAKELIRKGKTPYYKVAPGVKRKWKQLKSQELSQQLYLKRTTGAPMEVPPGYTGTIPGFRVTKEGTLERIQPPVKISRREQLRITPTGEVYRLEGKAVLPQAKRELPKAAAIISPPETFLQKATRKLYTEPQAKLRERITEPLFWSPLAKAGITPKELAKATGRLAQPFGLGIPKIKVKEVTILGGPIIMKPRDVREFTTGYITEKREKPLKYIYTTGAFFALGGVLGGVSRGVRLAGGLAPTLPALSVARGAAIVAPTVEKVVAVGLPVAYLGLKGREVARAERPAYQAGRIVAGEIEPLILGGLAAAKLYPKIIGYSRTLGKKLKPPEKIISPQALKGKAIPTAPKQAHLKQFKMSKRIYHATPETWKAPYITRPGVRELPGVYGAPKVSPYFLRIKGGYKPYGTKLFPTIGKPTIMEIERVGFRVGKWAKIPKVPKSPLGYKWTQPAKKGIAEVPLMKREIEAILRPGIELIKVKSKEYTLWRGVRVPIDVFRIKGVGQIVGKAPRIPGAGYYVTPPAPITTPLSYALGISSSILRPTAYRPTAPVSPISPLTPTERISPPRYAPPTYRPPSYPMPSAPSVPISPLAYTPPTYDPYVAPTYEPSVISEPERPITILKTVEKRVIAPTKIEVVPGYRVLVKRKGKFRPIGKRVLPRAEAILLGERRTRRTLAATFRIEKVNIGIKVPKKRVGALKVSRYYEPSPKIFRGYKIKKGKKVPLRETWIQRRGFRLGMPGEVREIQLFKKSKGGNKLKLL